MIILGYITAMQYWRQATHANYKALSYKKRWTPAKEITPKEENALQQVNPPWHILVPCASSRRKMLKIKSHVWHHPLQKGSILDSEKGFYISSPELVFIQMASQLEVVKLIELGFELCGTYAIQDDNLITRKPLTTISKLKSFILKMNRVYGKKKALRAIKYLVEGSASPMETILTMLLSLPHMLGGYALPKPVLNQRIDLTKEQNRFYIGDLFWPDARLIVEYDSNTFHVGANRIASDSIRRGNLVISGFMVISVTWCQLKSEAETDKLAHFFAKYMGRRIQLREPQFSQKRDELRRMLMASQRRHYK